MRIRPIIYSTTRATSEGYWFEKVFTRIYTTVTRARNLFIEGFVVEHWKAPKEIPTYSYTGVNPITGKKKEYTRFKWDWFVETFTKAARDRSEPFNCIIWHTTSYHKKRWGLKGFNGIYRADTDAYIEIFVVADNEEDFWRIVCHEIGHFVERNRNGDNLNTPTPGCGMVYDSELHKSDYCDSDIDAFFARQDLTAYDRKIQNEISRALLQISLIQALMKLLGLLKARPVYPIAKHTFLNRVTQGFGLPGPYRSGIHNGLDIGTPAGTPVYAPHDGEIYQVYAWHQSMGNALYYKFEVDDETYYMRCLHLLKPPVKGMYKKGDVIGFTGNTGMSTGPHLHVEVARKHIDNSILLSESTVRRWMVDPFKFFRLKVDNIIV